MAGRAGIPTRSHRARARRGSLIVLEGVVLLSVIGASLSSLRGATPEGLLVEVVARGLSGPVALAPAADGRVFVAERQSGRIRVIENGALLAAPVVTLAGVSTGERGLLGLVADPLPGGTPGDPATVLYAYHTPSADRARIVRISLGTDGARVEPVIDDLPAAAAHNGGALALGPDRCLYFSIGDLGDPAGTIPAGSRTGRIHRLALDGSIPADNPWPGRSEFCRGVRNCFGLAAIPDPAGGVALLLTDNGTTEDDEVNRVRGGAHLGWPELTGVAGRDDRVDPLRAWSPTTAPVGIVSYQGIAFPQYAGDIFFGEYVTGRIVRLRLDAQGIREDEVFLDRGPAPVYALAVAPDGALWFTFGDAVARVSRTATASFIRGDVDGNRCIDLRDVASLLSHLYRGMPIHCPAAADIDANGEIDASDALTLHRFLSGDLGAMTPPSPDCGRSPGERLPCPSHLACP